MTSSASPLPKLRATLRSCRPGWPHDAQSALDDIDGDDEEDACRADFEDRFGVLASERLAADNGLGLASLAVFLALNDMAREDEIFEVEDREVVIFKFFSGVDRYDVS